MSDITINYKGSTLGTMDASGTATIQTEGKYCEDDITLQYVKPSGGGEVPIKDVVFWDYDGTPLYSYTLTEANALTALPANPTHEGLTAEGWNWTLQDIKDQISECPGGTIDVGQTYIPNDNKTRIYITIPDGEPLTFYLRLGCSVTGNCTIDWGDGSTELTTQTGAKTYEHTYSAAGNYVIKLSVSSGTYNLAGSNSSSNRLYGNENNGYNRTRIKKIELGANVYLPDYALNSCMGLETITISKEVISFGIGVFGSAVYPLKALIFPKKDSSPGNYTNILGELYLLSVYSQPKNMPIIKRTNCKAIKRVTVTKAGFNQGGEFTGTGIEKAVFPTSGLTEIPSVFNGCNMLRNFTIPSSITTIGNESFKQCNSLSKIVIPSSVTTIGNSVFHSIGGLMEVHMQPTTPPSLGTNVFWGTSSELVIYVPYSEDHSVLNDYQTASNWLSYASKMQEEPQ